MKDLDAMRIFVRVAELTGFTRAADSLGLPKASVSTAVRQLEALLGTQLLHRTTRKVQMTDDGRVFYERAKDRLADVDELQGLFLQAPKSLRGRLRVDMPGGVARHFLIPALPAFLEAHPQLQIELSCTDRRVDVVREGFDCVIRVGTLGDTSLVARTLGAYRIVTCASPAYIARYGLPTDISELDAHRLVHYVTSFGSKADGWEYRDGNAFISRPMEGAVTVNSAEAYQAACIAGLGMVQVPYAGVRHLIDASVLVEVLTQYAAESMPVSLLYAHRRKLPQRVQAFMAWVAELMRPHLEPVERVG